MLRFFRNRRPKHLAVPARMDVAELLVARWHGYTPEQWNDLPAIVKVDHRESYHRAWGLGR